MAHISVAKIGLPLFKNKITTTTTTKKKKAQRIATGYLQITQ